MTVKVGFLGGLGEIGRNCATIEVDGRLALIDCGFMFPEEDMLGVDLVLPDFSSVLDRRDDVECVVLTHGHEDHIGALAYFLREANVPVYGTTLTVRLASFRIDDLGVEPILRAVEPREWVEVGPFKFTFVPVAHSVPQATGVVFDTPEGVVIHSGDFKLDPTPIDGVATDLGTFSGFGRRGVALLLADSTNAERPGFVPSEASLGQSLRQKVGEARGRVIIACFASHIHRVQQAVDAIVDAGRKFAFMGRSMLRNTELAVELGILDFPEEMRLPPEELLELPAEETAVISTGSQGEPYAALSLMAAGAHRNLTLEPDDTVIISATPVPGNETRVSRVINNLLRLGVTVHHGRNAHVHVSGHGAEDELRTFYNVVRPRAFVPVHGEYRHLVANARLAGDAGVEEVHVLEDGDQITLDGSAVTVERGVLPAGYVYLDGAGIGDVEAVLRDRRHLADDGVLIVTLGIEISTGQIVFGPDIDSHGLTDEPEEVYDMVRERVIEVVGELDRPVDFDTLRQRVRSAARNTVKGALERRPVVFPVLIEV